MTYYSPTTTGEYQGITDFKDYIEVNVRMAEWFAFVTEEDINLLVEKAIPGKTKISTSYAVNVFDGKLCVNFLSNF